VMVRKELLLDGLLWMAVRWLVGGGVLVMLTGEVVMRK
jgi:hypothetical protein